MDSGLGAVTDYKRCQDAEKSGIQRMGRTRWTRQLGTETGARGRGEERRDNTVLFQGLEKGNQTAPG